MARKKSQSAGNAAVFVLLIGVFVVLYILFLPAENRRELLYPNETLNGTGSSSTGKVNFTLMHESPRRLDFLSFNSYEHPISAFTLYKTSDYKLLAKFNAFSVKSNVFDTKAREFNFRMDNPENVNDVTLSFQALKHTGALIISLNGQVIYESEVTVSSPEPIVLPKEQLKENNTLSFAASSVGWEFWKSNEYQLDSIQITGDITDTSRQKSINVFYVTDSEFANLERSTIKFNPDCSPNNVAQLQVLINDQEVFSGIPDCGTMNPKEFPPKYLRKGENFVVFQTNMGSYLIDQILITTTLKELTYPIYYFDLTAPQFTGLNNGKYDVYVTLEFADTGNDRKAILVVNGKPKYVDSDGLLFTTKIPSDVITPANNWLKVEPDGTGIDVVNLIVELVER